MVPDAKKFFNLVVGQDLFLNYQENAKGSQALSLVDRNNNGSPTPKGGAKNKKKTNKKSFDKFQFVLTK